MNELPMISVVPISVIDGKPIAGRKDHHEAWLKSPLDNQPCQIHIIPRAELKSHDYDDCWCNPEFGEFDLGESRSVKGLIHKKSN